MERKFVHQTGTLEKNIKQSVREARVRTAHGGEI